MSNEICNVSRSDALWPDLTPVVLEIIADTKQLIAIKPPPQFQDSPPSPVLSDTALQEYKSARTSIDASQWTEKYATKLAVAIFEEALTSCKMAWSAQSSSHECQPNRSFRRTHHRSLAGRWSGPRLCWTPELLPFSPCHNRPGSRSSLSSSRLSSSHNSLAANKADDSSFITSAMSHDVLTGSEISDMYNVPFDSDIYAVPIDVVKPLNEQRTPQRPKRQQRHHRKRRRHTSTSSQSELDRQVQQAHKPKNTNVSNAVNSSQTHVSKSQRPVSPDTLSETGKRHSVPGSSAAGQIRSDRTEPIHMTLQEVRQYLQNLYSSSSDSSENKPKVDCSSPSLFEKPNNNNRAEETCNNLSPKSLNCDFVSNSTNNNTRKHKKKTFVINLKNKNAKESCELNCKDNTSLDYSGDKEKSKKNPSRNSFSTNLKQTLCNIFRIRKHISPEHAVHGRRAVVLEVVEDSDAGDGATPPDKTKAPFLKRALPPLPAAGTEGNTDDGSQPEGQLVEEEPSMDFASSIEKVKDYGWYWGPISGEAAERILSNEPDGSFIVRDSSDDHYIFSLTFKLNGCIRHVRIEHDQGNFSFGSCTKFKSHTIVDFIENAVEHSRSGRYLFFLHRRPVLGPMRVQLLHPVSRYKQVQSLQHTCRFVILKLVRRDLIGTLPLPRRVIDYLSTPHYYSEQLDPDADTEDSPAASPPPPAAS